MQTIDESAVRGTVRDVLRALMAIPDEDVRFPRAWWPGSCCEQSSCAIAAVLEDRALGEWLLVSGKRREQMSGHSWLTFKGDGGEDIFSIDVTLHQFEDFRVRWPSGFVGQGASPARAKFTEQVNEVRIWDWPYLGDERQPFRATIRQVREILAR